MFEKIMALVCHDCEADFSLQNATHSQFQNYDDWHSVSPIRWDFFFTQLISLFSLNHFILSSTEKWRA